MGVCMLFMTIWQVNPTIPPRKVAEVAHELTSKGLWPIKGVKVVGWYISPGGKGVTITDAENGEDVYKSWITWTNAHPGLFTCYETMPVLPAEKAIPLSMGK